MIWALAAAFILGVAAGFVGLLLIGTWADDLKQRSDRELAEKLKL